MSMNSFGHLFRFSTWGESHGKAIGVTIDGCPPNIKISEEKIQIFEYIVSNTTFTQLMM